MLIYDTSHRPRLSHGHPEQLLICVGVLLVETVPAMAIALSREIRTATV